MFVAGGDKPLKRRVNAVLAATILEIETLFVANGDAKVRLKLCTNPRILSGR